MVTLIRNGNYVSFRFDDGSYRICLVRPTGEPYAQVDLAKDGTVNGTVEDLHSIIAHCVDFPIDDVPSFLNQHQCTAGEFIAAQMENDEFVHDAEIENI